jgi:oxygen-independent coproporphyrinogen-3 oxidase
MMGLRLAEGVPLARYREETGTALADELAPSALRRLIDGGFATLDEQRFAATAAGRQRLDALLGALLG